MEIKTQGYSRNLVIQCFVICLGSSAHFGYHFSSVNLPSEIIKDFYNSTYADRGTPVTSYMLTFLFSLTVAIFRLGCIFGTLLAGCFSKTLGRKKILLLSQIPQLVGSVLQSICVVLGTPELLMIGRLVCGVGTGMALQIAPVFISELSPPSIRGTMMSANQLVTCMGIFLAGVFGLDHIFGTEHLWMYIFLIPILPAILSAAVLLFFVESPRFLLIDKQNEAEAVKSLQFIRQSKDVCDEIEEMKKEVKSLESDTIKKYTLVELIKAKEYRLRLLLVFLLSFSMPATGMTGVFFYTRRIFRNIGLDQDEMQYSVLGIFGAMVVGTFLSLYLVDRIGRRLLLIIPLSIITCLLLILTICNKYQTSATWLSYIGVVCTIIFSLAFTTGIGNLLWVIPAELFEQGPRDAAVSFSVSLNWIAMLLFTLTFELMAEAMDHFVFLMFMGLNLFFTLMFFWKLPETKNKTFEEIAKNLVERGGKPPDDNQYIADNPNFKFE